MTRCLYCLGYDVCKSVRGVFEQFVVNVVRAWVFIKCSSDVRYNVIACSYTVQRIVALSVDL